MLFFVIDSLYANIIYIYIVMKFNNFLMIKFEIDIDNV